MTMLLPLFILVGFIAGYFVNVMAYHLSPLEDKTALTFRQVLVHFWQKKYAWHDTVPLILCVAAANSPYRCSGLAWYLMRSLD